MNVRSKIIDLDIISSEKVSSERVIQILKNNSSDVKSIKFQPPKLGDRGFGSFRVKWKVPKYGVSI